MLLAARILCPDRSSVGISMYQYFDRCRVTALHIFLRDLLPVDAFEQLVEGLEEYAVAASLELQSLFSQSLAARM
jgi:hypothetical protein